MNIINCFLPEVVILIFIILNIFLSFFIKKNIYRNAKATAGLAILLSGISIFYTQINIQENALDNLYVSNIFTVCFKCFILISAILIITASHNLIREQRKHSFKFFSYFLFGILASFLLISSNDIILSDISLILLCCACYNLIRFRKNNNAKKASLIYLYHYIAGIIFAISGSILLYKLTGNSNYTAVNNLIQVFSQNINYTLSGICFVCSIILFLGLIPAYNNISGLFEKTSSGICLYLSLIPVIAYLSFITRLFVFIYSANPVIPFIMLIASIIAIVGTIIQIIKENNIKKLFASAAVINSALFMTAITSVEVYSISSVIFGLLVYIFTLSGLWSAAIIFRTRYKSDDINSYSGLFYNRPYYTSAFIVCLISLIGLPPTGGFISKIYEYIALSKIDLIYFIALTVILAAMILFIFIFSKIIRIFFLKQNSPVSIKRMFIIPKFTLYLSSICLILFFIFADKLIKLSQIIAYYI